MATERKVSEGEECIRQAEKYLKTSFFKWKPDYDSAANEYSKAATCFKGARALSKCKDAHLRAADCYIKNNSFFSAAKCYEQAALMAKEMKDYAEVVTLTDKACQMFREYGTPDTAALSMERGAKIIESYHPEKAIEMFAKASEVVMLEERPKQAAEYAGKAVRLLLKLKRYDEAAEMMKKELQFHLEGDNRPGAGRLVVALVLVHLTRDDYVAAQKVFKDWNGYLEQEEHITLEKILEGYDEGDPELLREGLNHPFIKHMDVEYAKLARSLQAAAVAQPHDTTTNSTVLTEEASGDNIQENNADDFSGGLL